MALGRTMLLMSMLAAGGDDEGIDECDVDWSRRT